MNFYLFVNSDSYDFNDKKVHSPKIAAFRLKNKVYPIYHRTRLKKFLKPGDSIIFYLAGSPASETKSFVAYGKIKEIKIDSNYNEDDIHLSQPIEKIVILKSLNIKKSVSIYKVKDKLSFITKKKKWGPSMQGGILRITDKDFDLIVKEINK